MTPKEKARQLYETYFIVTDSRVIAKICAFCAVNEILNIDFGVPVIYQIIDKNSIENNIKVLGEYWQDVKNELENL